MSEPEPTTPMDATDLGFVLLAARRGVGLLPGPDLARAGVAIARIESVLEEQNAKAEAAAADGKG